MVSCIERYEQEERGEDDDRGHVGPLGFICCLMEDFGRSEAEVGTTLFYDCSYSQCLKKGVWNCSMPKSLLQDSSCRIVWRHIDHVSRSVFARTGFPCTVASLSDFHRDGPSPGISVSGKADRSWFRSCSLVLSCLINSYICSIFIYEKHKRLVASVCTPALHRAVVASLLTLSKLRLWMDL